MVSMINGLIQNCSISIAGALKVLQTCTKSSQWFCTEYATMRQEVIKKNLLHDDVTKWKHFPRYRPLAKGIHPWPVHGFPAQRPVTRNWNFGVFFVLRLNKRSIKQSRHRWFGTILRSLWRPCNASDANVRSRTDHIASIPIIHCIKCKNINRHQNVTTINAFRPAFRQHLRHFYMKC